MTLRKDGQKYAAFMVLSQSRWRIFETFGCQMNFHDSEKVVGTLISEGYQQVQREEDADLIFYNTCSIRDKAEQKVFHRLNDFKKLHKEGKRFGVLGCVAQQEGEKIFERAPYVSLVAGSASYRNLPEMLIQIESGAARHRPRRPRDRPDLRDRVHRAHQSASRLHHHHRRLRQVLRLLRCALHARQGAQPHFAVGAERGQAHG
jgi:tRNA A37 methylthiotransferase MiaB